MGENFEDSPRPIQWSTWRLSVAVICAVVASVLIGSLLLQPLNRGLGLWVTEVFLLLGVAWAIVRKSGRDPIEYAGLRSRRSPLPTRGIFLFGIALGVTNYFAFVIPIQEFSGSFFSRSTRELFDITEILREQSPGQLALIISGACLAAPLCEEFVFRGVIQRGFMPTLGAWRAILLTALIFSAFHVDPVGFAARVELGALFGLLFQRTGSLWPGIAAHAANNLVSSVLYFVGEAQQTKPDEPVDWGAVALTGAIGMLFFLATLFLGRRQWRRFEANTHYRSQSVQPERSSGPGADLS